MMRNDVPVALVIGAVRAVARASGLVIVRVAVFNGHVAMRGSRRMDAPEQDGQAHQQQQQRARPRSSSVEAALRGNQQAAQKGDFGSRHESENVAHKFTQLPENLVDMTARQDQRR